MATTTKPPSSSTAIDPLTFSAWPEAFAHPIPTVRTLETQLRKHISENQNKLRSLVGNSYRDLLGTAEKIIEMDETTDRVEGIMGGIGARCNAGLVEGRRSGRGKREGGRGWLVNVRVLGCVLDAVGECVKRRKGGRSEGIVAAKLLVLARLVYKSCGEGEVMEELRRRMVGLRKRLLRYIEVVVRRVGGEREMVVDTLCAYALVTSSSPAEVLKYFLATRFEGIQAFEDAEAPPTDEQVLELVDLYASTLADTRAVFPKLFSESMARLQKVPLFQDPQIISIGSLNLDVYGSWIDESTRTFTPWVRQDQLSTNDVSRAIASWATQAQSRLNTAVKACLNDNNDITSILAVRTGVLQRFLPLLEPSSKSWQDSHLNAFHDLRKAFLERLERVAAETARTVEKQDVQASTTSRPASSGLWDLPGESINVKAGGTQFRQAILQRRHGRTDDSHTDLNAWVDQLDKIWEVIASMRTAKWDTDEIDVEMTEGDPLSVILSKKDSEHLQSQLRKVTTEALQAVYGKIEDCASDVGIPPDRLLRHLREVNARRRYLGDRIKKDAAYVPQGLVTGLHKRLSEVTLDQHKFESHPYKTAVMLWDGSPELPVQPTPATYRMLVKVQKSMASTGNDLWTKDAVVVFKSCLAERIEEQFKHDLEADDDRSQRTTQKLFDALYLQRVVGEKALEDVVKSLREEVKLDTAPYERLVKSAHEYWKRTYLLFGLLAK